jgi:putative N6-adenine-specific DNA methylase
MTDKPKPRSKLSLSKPAEEEKPRQAKRPATSRRVNIERDRSKKPAPSPAPETAWEKKRSEDKARPPRARPPQPAKTAPGQTPAGTVRQRPAHAKEGGREGGENRRREKPAAERKPERPDTRPVRTEQFFATCPRGLENALAEELKALGAQDAQTTGGGVGFFGPMTLCYAANLHSRLATRILLRVSAGKYQNEEDVYQGTLAVFWHKWFDASRTIAVKVVAQDSQLKSLNFITLKIKDAVCDRFREESGMRPSVQTLHPDIRIHAFLTRDRYTLYLDTSGESLYKRGLRKQSGVAPINENLAAGILKLSGWQPGEALYDPMCGSGTFLLEAAQMALNIAPGLGRDFAFERMLRMDAKAWARMKAEAQAACQPVRPLPIYGSDVMGRSLRDADSNLKAAGLREAVTLSKADILDIAPPAESGVLVMNPPYGVRLGEEEELAALYPKLGDVLKRNFANWRAYIISADANLPKLIRLSASKKTPLFNGALECRLYEYKLVEGSNR